MITKISGIGSFPGNRIFIKDNEGNIITSAFVLLDCTFEVDVAEFILSNALHVVEMDRDNHVVESCCIRFPVSVEIFVRKKLEKRK